MKLVNITAAELLEAVQAEAAARERIEESKAALVRWIEARERLDNALSQARLETHEPVKPVVKKAIAHKPIGSDQQEE